jgi:Ran GTPase-activating protein (RanGAP) involved in mRNA processing and transport
VHNLRRFLGKDKLAELREKLPSGIFEREVVVLRRKQYVVDLEMQLWKLQGYLAEYRELYRDLEEPQMQGLDGESEEDDDDEDDAEDEEDEGW